MQKSSFRVAERMAKRAEKRQSTKYFRSNAITSDSIESRPFSATDAVPGTQEKLRVLVERIENGLPLWHPADRSTDVMPLDTEVEANHSDSNHRPTEPHATEPSATEPSATGPHTTGPHTTGPHVRLPRDKTPSGDGSDLCDLFGICGEVDEFFN